MRKIELEELRELVQKGVDGGLGITGFEFVEVFAHQDKGATKLFS